MYYASHLAVSHAASPKPGQYTVPPIDFPTCEKKYLLNWFPRRNNHLKGVTDLPRDETEEQNRVISKDLVCSVFLRVALCKGDGEGRLTNVLGCEYGEEEHVAVEALGKSLAERGQHAEAVAVWERRIPAATNSCQRASLFLLIAKSYFGKSLNAFKFLHADTTSTTRESRK
ncbi:hypothetical protein E2C01_046943 [Portunus trituberculatus]|uniref:Uncharacterized protein n=1 Tax=Portunus trituberculatus TaxID=210409 RepID=A0A5B7G646_PORTR|nr:hypothetical protein [Portunus trituberculatus]